MNDRVTAETAALEADPTPQRSPIQAVVMGVSGTGKTVVGRAIADQIGFEFIEGDAYHPPSNIEKMSAGIPLTDADRAPWLETLSAMLATNRHSQVGSVLACSALKRSYRDTLRGDAPMRATFFLHLDLPYDVLLERMTKRDHFMPPSLLRSQFETLEPLQPDEYGATLDHDDPLEQVVSDAVRIVRETD